MKKIEAVLEQGPYRAEVERTISEHNLTAPVCEIDDEFVYFNGGERIKRFQVTGRCFDSAFNQVELDCEGYLSFTVELVDSPIGGMPFYCQAKVEVLPNEKFKLVGGYWRGHRLINPPRQARFIRWGEGKSPDDLTDEQRKVAGMAFAPFIREML